MTTVDNKNYASIKEQKFYCNFCHYGTSKKSSYSNHCKSIKHMKATGINQSYAKIGYHLLCDNCEKPFSDRSGLWRHKKKCINKESSIYIPKDFSLDKELVLSILQQNQEVLKQNNELQNQIIDVVKSGSHNNNTNSYNKTFNLQLFLNETCKNAMNIMDFVDSLKLQLADLENMGEIGYVNGMSNIIIQNLKNMDVSERPVHCTDKKRETLYIKDDNKWNKEDDNKPKMRKAIQHIAHKNAKLINEFKEKYPDCIKSESKYSDQYNKMVIEAMGGGVNIDELFSEQKIIKKISKEVILEKQE